MGARGGDPRTFYGKLYGQEKNLTTAAVARMNLFLHGLEDFVIERGDTLRNPAFFTGDSLATYDCVIANPPFSLEKWGDEVWASILRWHDETLAVAYTDAVNRLFALEAARSTDEESERS